MRSELRLIGLITVCCSSAICCAAQGPPENAWSVLDSGLTNSNTDKRVRAVRLLGLLPGDPKAEDAALTALKDEKEGVRSAAAQALGDMGAKNAKPQLLEALADKEPAVIIAAGHSLVVLGDEKGYGVFYAILTGRQKTGTSLTEQQKKMLKDPKKMAGLGFQVGMGFVPFGGLALGGFKMLTRDDTSPVLAAAALTLAKDPDPKSGQALADAAAKEEKWLVRAAAFDAITKRGDPSLKPVAANGLQDEKEEVQYSAAAAVIRLSDIEESRKVAPKPSPAKRKTTPRKTQ